MKLIGRMAMVALGVCSVTPLAYAVALSVHVIPRIESLGEPGVVQPNAYFRLLSRLTTAHIIVFGLVIAILTAFLYANYRDTRATGQARTGWALALLLGNILVFPLFWYLRLWVPSRQRSAPLPERQGS